MSKEKFGELFETFKKGLEKMTDFFFESSVNVRKCQDGDIVILLDPQGITKNRELIIFRAVNKHPNGITFYGYKRTTESSPGPDKVIDIKFNDSNPTKIIILDRVYFDGLSKNLSPK